MNDTRTMVYIETLRTGQSIPEYLITADPTSQESKLGRGALAAYEIDVYERGDGYWLIPADGCAGKDRPGWGNSPIEIRGAHGITFGAANRPVAIATAWAVLRVDGGGGTQKLA